MVSAKKRKIKNVKIESHELQSNSIHSFFEGRLNRASYFLLTTLSSLLLYFIWIFDLSLEFHESIILSIFILILEANFIILRLHDLDRPESDIFYTFIPVYNLYFSLILLFVKGTKGSNKYGRDPLIQNKK